METYCVSCKKYTANKNKSVRKNVVSVVKNILQTNKSAKSVKSIYTTKVSEKLNKID